VRYEFSRTSKTLYVGVTGNLHRRVWQHKQGCGSEFCKRYKIDRLVYYASFDDVIKAINREKADQRAVADQENSVDRFDEPCLARSE